jgi:beta-galactosidase
LGAVVAWPLLNAGDRQAFADLPTSGPASRISPFNTNWLFGVWAAGGTDVGFDDTSLDTVALPHTVAPLSWRNWDPAAWEKTWLYRKHFDAPAGSDGMRVFLDCAGAMTSSNLTLNGHSLPGRVGGYLPFTAELTGVLLPKGNVLACVLDSRFNIDVPPDRPAPYGSPSVDFWQPGGIYRDASLRVVPQVFLADVFAKPTNVLDASKRAVDVEFTLDAASVPQGSLSVTVDLRDGSRLVSSATVPVTVTASGQTSGSVTLTGLGDITLWELDAPHLYDVVATLSIDGSAVHDYRRRIGFRDASFTLDGFFLNGRRVKLFGVNRHQFFPFVGGAMPDRVQRKDAEILRNDLNCNMVRCSHYPQSEAFLDACDELGLMVWEEAPGWGYLGDDAWQALAYRDVGDMVRRDRNHPSVIIWGARLNETPDDVPFYTQTRDLAHSLDSSRPTVGAMAGRHNTTNYVQDVFSQNDYSHSIGQDGERQPELLPPRTDRPYMVSEAVGTLSGPAQYYRRIDPQDVQQGQAAAHGRVHDIGASDNRYCGILPWSGYDYPSGSGNQYQGVKYTGVVDLFRVPKPGAAIYESQVDPARRPVVRPAFYWDFGPTSPVNGLAKAMICSNLDRLEIYVGGTHFATATPDTTDYAHLRYPPSFVDFSTVDGTGHPELRIDGYLGATKVVSQTFSSDPSSDRLSLSADDDQLVGDGTDATRLVFRAVGKYGQPRPYVGGDVTLSVAGPAALLGDNPFPFGDTGGVGAVWLRTLRDTPGSITVTASHPTLGTATASIRAQLTAPAGVPATYGTLQAGASSVLAVPGQTSTVSVTFTNNGLPNLDDVELKMLLPAGWTAQATTATTFTGVKSGQQVKASWQISVPGDAAAGQANVVIQAAYSAHGENAVSSTSLALLVPYATLAKAYDNAGISDDSNVDSADFDGVGDSYSAQALAAAGLAPGTQVQEAGVSLTWPDVPPGTLDNLVANGQTVLLTGSGSKLAFLGASSSGNHGGQGTVYYTDGTTSSFSVTLDDYWSPPTDNDAVASTPYINSQGIGGRPRGQRQHTVYVDVVAVDITPGKQVMAVTLPFGGYPGPGRISGMHVFAIGVGG